MIVRGTGIDTDRLRYPTSRKGILDAGLIEESHEAAPPLIWIDGILSISEAENLLDYQRVNKIPCMDYLCYKSTLFSELNKMRRVFPNHFEFYPHTYLLPDDLPEFMREHSFICGRTATAPTWVVKPRSGCCGKGIHFIQTVQDAEAVNYPAVAQLMVNPFLLDGKKFDFRFFLLISSLEPFTVFIYREGIARFCTQDYVAPTKQTLDRPYAQLTNTAINKTSDANPDDFTKLASGVLADVIAKKPSASRVWDEICHVSLLTVAGLFPSIVATLPLNGGAQLRSKMVDDTPKITIPNTPGSSSLFLKTANQYPFLGAAHKKRVLKKKRKLKRKKGKTVLPLPDGKDPDIPVFSCDPAPGPAQDDTKDPKEIVLTEAQHYWHILGIDIILDSKGHPKVLELNDRPSLQVTAPFEKELKEGLIREAFLHLSLDGSSFGNSENSKWQQIMPVPGNTELAGTIRSMMAHKSDLKYQGRAGVNSPAVQRMMAAGIKPEVHETYRSRFFGPPKLDPTAAADKLLTLPPLNSGKEDTM